MELTTRVLPERGGHHPERMLVLLHGYGATERDVLALGPLVDPDGHFLVVGIRGSIEVSDEDDPAWFHYGPLGPDRESFTRSLADLDTTIDSLCSHHVMARDEVVVGGFSQGAAMALALAATVESAGRPAGVLCLSGFLPDVIDHAYTWAAIADLPVFLDHGEGDTTVPVELARDTATTLEGHRARVSYGERDTGHQVTIEGLTRAREWLDHVRDNTR
jgi:phospholipase/carboxylesterase